MSDSVWLHRRQPTRLPRPWDSPGKNTGVGCHCLLLALYYLFSPLNEGSGSPLQYSCLENPMDRGAWKAAVHGVAEGRTRLSDFAFTFHFHALEKEMAIHSSTLAWKIPWTEEPDRLQSMGSQSWARLSDFTFTFTFMTSPELISLSRVKS